MQVVTIESVTPIASAALSGLWAVCAFAGRWYGQYVVFAVEMSTSVYAALWAPVSGAVGLAAATAYGVVAWSIAAVFDVPLRIHVIVSLLQSALLVWLTWHASSFADDAHASAVAAGNHHHGQPRPRQPTLQLSPSYLQLAGTALLGDKWGAWLDWSAVANALQHLSTQAARLATYAYHHVSALLLVFFLRMLPFTGTLSVLVEAIALPALSTGAFADAFRVDAAQHPGMMERSPFFARKRALVCGRLAVSVLVNQLVGRLIDVLFGELLWLLFAASVVGVLVLGARARTVFG